MTSTSKRDDSKDLLLISLIEQIIKVVPTESMLEKPISKVALLNDISVCIREEGETPALFGNKFKSVVAKYVVQIGHIDHSTNCRMALMMVKHSRLPTSIKSNIIIQLSEKYCAHKNKLKRYVMNKAAVASFLEYIEEFKKDLDVE